MSLYSSSMLCATVQCPSVLYSTLRKKMQHAEFYCMHTAVELCIVNGTHKKDSKTPVTALCV